MSCLLETASALTTWAMPSYLRDTCWLPALALVSQPAAAQELFAGAYDHAANTPLTLNTGESGLDIAAGYRFPPLRQLRVIGSPSPYVIASVNLKGDTSFAGGGLSWKIGQGPVFLRPAIGMIVHDGPAVRVAASGDRTDLGSRVLFEPEIGLGYRVDRKVTVELSWMHISHARLFDRSQNPGIDMIGLRFNWRLQP